MRNLTLLLVGVVCTLMHSCSTYMKAKQDKCLSQAIDFVLDNDAHMKLQPKNELLIILNVIKNPQEKLKLAMLSKDDFPEFLINNKESAKGYTYYKEVFLIGYGDCSKIVNLLPLNQNFDFLKPAVIKEPEPGYPPLPPSTLEPLIYSFELKAACFQFEQKTVADTLIN